MYYFFHEHGVARPRRDVRHLEGRLSSVCEDILYLHKHALEF